MTDPRDITDKTITSLTELVNDISGAEEGVSSWEAAITGSDTEGAARAKHKILKKAAKEHMPIRSVLVDELLAVEHKIATGTARYADHHYYEVLENFAKTDFPLTFAEQREMEEYGDTLGEILSRRGTATTETEGFTVGLTPAPEASKRKTVIKKKKKKSSRKLDRKSYGEAMYELEMKFANPYSGYSAEDEKEYEDLRSAVCRLGLLTVDEQIEADRGGAIGSMMLGLNPYPCHTPTLPITETHDLSVYSTDELLGMAQLLVDEAESRNAD